MKKISYLIIVLVAIGAFGTGALISGAQSILQNNIAISAKADIYLKMPLGELKSQEI